MYTPTTTPSRQACPPVTAPTGEARQIYDSLIKDPLVAQSRHASRAFLEAHLEQAASLPCDMPHRPEALVNWLEQRALDTGHRYKEYLAARKSGEPRRYFSSRAHALAFIQRVAPTKLVDGAWLYGTLSRWHDPRFHALIRTYLEELGDGDPAQNHVLLFQRLLAEHGCEPFPEISDEHYIQGALQLALGYHGAAFMPEVIGYNLGYEQLPLHLLITAFELNELDIDSYYFTLHITIDNVAAGHARKAVQSVLDTQPTEGDAEAFMARVASGYRLNDVGLGSTSIIDAFDVEQEVIEMLERKRQFGMQMHSDFCRIEGRTVNEWLTQPGQIPGFLQALQKLGWVKRHQAPEQSRFWQLIEGKDALMLGVFTPFEKQLVYDWIAGDWLNEPAASHLAENGRRAKARPRAFRPRSRRDRPAPAQEALSATYARRIVGDVDHDLGELTQELQQLPEALRMQRLIRLMAPSSHTSAAGLLATRLFAAALH